LSHTWIQRAETLKDVPIGSKVRFTASVRTYNKRTGEESTGFKFPDEIVVLKPIVFPSQASRSPIVAMPSPAQPAPQPRLIPATPANTLEILLSTKDVVDKLGGTATVSMFLDSVTSIGGWERVREVEKLTQMLGGVEDVRKVLAILK
jgi:hypothetical protein